MTHKSAISFWEHPSHRSKTDLDTLLCSGHEPTEHERDEWRRSADAHLVIIDEIDAEIRLAAAFMDRLTRKRREIVEHLTNIDIVLHSFRTLPHDILADIFQLCIRQWADEAPIHHRGSDSLQIAEPPWTLGQVCRQWRRTALSLPSLWSYILLDFEQHMEEHPPSVVANKLALFLERSGGTCDLNLRLYANIHGRKVMHHPAFALLLETVHRWARLQAGLPSSALHRIAQKVLPRLVHLHIPWYFSDTQFLLPISFGPMPLMREFVTSGSRVSETVIIPWEQIRTFKRNLTDLYEEDLPVIQRMKRVEVLKFSVPDQPWYRPAFMFDYPNVWKVELEDERGDARVDAVFFDRVQVPALSDLSIIMRKCILMSLPIPPYPERLTHLSIDTRPHHMTEIDQFVDFLSKMTCVEVLRLASPSLPEAFIQALMVTESTAAPLLSKLKKLSLEDSMDPTVPTSGIVLDMIESRIQPFLTDKKVTQMIGSISHLEELHVTLDNWHRLKNADEHRWRNVSQRVCVFLVSSR